MKTYVTASSQGGLRLPHSGALIGMLADAFRLKALLRDDLPGVNYKTVQRYFDGERILPETVDAILDALFEGLIPNDLPLPENFGSETKVKPLVAKFFREFAQFWDVVVADINSLHFPVSEAEDLPIPALRLVVLDLGLRVGAWATLREFRESRAPDWTKTWLHDGAVGRFLQSLMHKSRLNFGTLAEKVDVTVQSVDAWRSGESLPTSAHIEKLGSVLGAAGGGRHVVEYKLRLIVAIQALKRNLKAVCGDERIEDMIGALLRTARHIHTVQTMVLPAQAPPKFRPPLPGMTWAMMRKVLVDQMRPRLWDAVLLGAHCPTGRTMCQYMAEQVATFNQEVQADFLALSGNWADRMRFWTEILGTVRQGLDLARAELKGTFGADLLDGPDLTGALKAHALRMREFDWKPEPGSTMFEFAFPPKIQALNRVVAADRAASLGDSKTALAKLRQAVKELPGDAAVHFKLGGWAWQVGYEGRRKNPDLGLMEEGLLECRIAVQLDPDFGNARNEIGVILSNMGRHEEAEAAFAEAEPYYGKSNHHWFCRGNNFIALDRLEDARRAFELAIECSKDGEHVDAKAQLAITLMALGKTREGRSLGLKVKHVRGSDPTEDWQMTLSAWRNWAR